MDFRRDTHAASPLVVIATFVAVAVLLTAGIYAVAFDRPEDRLHVVAVDVNGSLAFDVTQAAGGLSWDELTLRLLDRAGTDQSATFLQVPAGDVNPGDRITVSPQPPAGSYLLLVLQGSDELARLRIDV